MPTHSRASGQRSSPYQAGNASTGTLVTASSVMQQSLGPRPMPTIEQVRPLYNELSCLSHTIRRVLTRVVNPQEPLVLTVTECILAKKVKQCVRENFVSFVSCTLRLPHVKSDAERTDILLEIIAEFHRDGRNSLKKMYTSLAFSCIYLCYLIDGCDIDVNLISHLLARFYLKNHLSWLIEIRGLSTAVKREHPKLWLAVTTRWLFACGTLSQ
ncbi:putative ORFA4.5L [Alcelaphine gammaherpesvirus 1]|nr:putative ORFA4.5L [Alcelaphine gammaherpesvirus 1]